MRSHVRFGAEVVLTDGIIIYKYVYCAGIIWCANIGNGNLFIPAGFYVLSSVLHVHAGRDNGRNNAVIMNNIVP